MTRTARELGGLLVAWCLVSGCGFRTELDMPSAAGAGGAGPDGGGAAPAPSPEVTQAVTACPADLALGLGEAPSYTFAVDPLAPPPPFQRCGALGEVARDVALSRDGRRLAVLAAETVRLYGTDPWREIAHLAHGTEPIDGVAFSPDGSRLATMSSYAGEVALWDASAGALLRLYSDGKAAKQLLAGGTLAFSSDGRRLATALGTIIDLESGAAITVDGIHGGQNSGLWFTNGDATLLARTLYRTGDSWAGTLIQQFATSDGQAQDSLGDSGVLSADLRMAAGVAYWTANLTVAWVGTPAPAVALQIGVYSLPPPLGNGSGGRGRGNLVALTNQAEGLVVQNDDAFVVVAPLDPGRTIARIARAPNMRFVAMSPRDEIVTSGDGQTVGWSWQTGAALWSQPFDVNSIRWSADGRTAAAVGPGAFFRVLRGDSFEVLCAPPGGRRAQTVVSSNDGQSVVVQYADGGLELRGGDLSLRSEALLPGVDSPGTPVAISDGDGTLVTMENPYSTGPLAVWSLPDGRRVATVPQQFDYWAAISPDGTKLAHGGASGVSVLDLAGGAPLLSLDQGQGGAFSADGARVAIATAGVFATFDAADGTPGRTFAPSGSARLNGLVLSRDWSVAVGMTYNSGVAAMVSWRPPDGPGRGFTASNDTGQMVLSSDGTILATNEIIGFVELVGEFLKTTLWDVPSGTALQQFEDHPVTLLRDGRRLIGADGALFCRAPRAPR